MQYKILKIPFFFVLIILGIGSTYPIPNSKDNKTLHNNRTDPIIGAIRWDGWVGPLDKAGLVVERTLSPHQFHFRTPFYSKEISYDSIQCRDITQKIIDKEISYAKYAGIDYWAFCWYPPSSGLSTARKLYLSSTHRNDVNWCVILGTGPFNDNANGKWLVKEFKESNYQKVLNGRPLVYFFPSSHTTANQLQRLRKLSRDAGVANPYIVAMAFSAKDADSIAISLHADAISCYASSYNFKTGSQYNGANYFPTVCDSDLAGWLSYKATGKELIPWVTTGWDPRPRIETPTPWVTYPPNGWAKEGTPDQIAHHLHNAIKWVQNNRKDVEANTILIYAWNEFDEGGWICPTLGDNTSRLDAIKDVLQNKN